MCFQLKISTVWKVIKKLQLRGTVEVKTRSDRPRKHSDSKETKPPYDTKDLLEG